MIDALGFKGIWKRSDPLHVIQKLRAISDAVEHYLDRSFGDRRTRTSFSESRANGLEVVQAVALSDTLVFAVAWKSPGLLQDLLRDPTTNEKPVLDDAVFSAHALAFAANAASAAVLAATRSEPTLAFRGAIAFGEFELDSDGRFLVGPAVDDAAEHHEMAQGAFIWTAPSALNILTSPAPATPSSPVALATTDVLFLYRVPLKNAFDLDTLVVNPFAHCATADECKSVEARILDSFSGGTLDVVVKKQRTETFLKAAKAAWDRRSAHASTETE
jgi:hypothetical protein